MRHFIILTTSVLLAACGPAPADQRHQEQPQVDTLGRHVADRAMDLYRAGDREGAVEVAEHLLDMDAGHAGPKARAAAWIVIGRVAQDGARFADAVDAYEHALDLTRRSGDRGGEGRALNQLSNVHRMRGDHEAAYRYAFDNLRVKEETADTPGMAHAHHNLALIHYELGDPDAAEHALATSLAIKERLGDSLGIHNALSLLCMLAIDRGEHDAAIAHMERALAIMERNFPHLDPVPEYTNLGLAHDGAGRRNEAMRYYRDALRALEDHPNDAHRAVVLNNIGQLLMDEGRTDEAGPFLHESLDLARAVGSRLDEKAALSSLLRHHKALGRHREALETSGALMAVHDSLLGEESVRSMNELRVRYDTERDKAENERLQQANELAQARLARQRSIILALVLGTLLLIVCAIVLVRNWRRRTALRMLELEHQALRAQMDPHFLLNALNSVPGLYYEHGPARTADYVGHLGQLLRLILDSSALRTVAVQDEADLLAHYFHVMAFRHPGRFTFSIRVDADIDPQRTGMPPMLLQPLVENAVLHGAIERAEGGHVEVHIASAKDGLHCCVRDNGPGMAQPPDLSAKGRPSGLRITHERILLANGSRSQGLVLRAVRTPEGEDGTEACFTVRTGDLWA